MAWSLAWAATICCWRPASSSFPSARVSPKLAISTRSSGRLIVTTSMACFSPSTPVFTNRTIQAPRPPPTRDQRRNYRLDARTPNLQAVPVEHTVAGEADLCGDGVVGHPGLAQADDLSPPLL